MVVFFLQAVNFLAQVLVLRPLLPVDNHAIGAEHHVQEEPYSDCGYTQCGQPALRAVQPSQSGVQVLLHSLNYAIAEILGLRSTLY
jgi:hypothetical protein